MNVKGYFVADSAGFMSGADSFIIIFLKNSLLGIKLGGYLGKNKKATLGLIAGAVVGGALGGVVGYMIGDSLSGKMGKKKRDEEFRKMAALGKQKLLDGSFDNFEEPYKDISKVELTLGNPNEWKLVIHGEKKRKFLLPKEYDRTTSRKLLTRLFKKKLIVK